MTDLRQAILEPTDERARNRALQTLLERIRNNDGELPRELRTFVETHHTSDPAQAALLGLILWELEGHPRPVPPHVMVRVFPGCFADEAPTVEAASLDLLGERTTEDVFDQTSNRNLLDEENNEHEAWYATKLLSRYTRDICRAFDRRRART